MKKNNPFEQWEEFCNYLRTSNRFILTKKWDRFVQGITASACKRKKRIKKGETYWRARIGEGPKMQGKRIVNRPLSKKEIQAPPREMVCDGRSNPKGMPCLYLAQDIDTAIAEIRPYINAPVTVGLFELNRDIDVVDIFDNRFSIAEYHEKLKKGKRISLSERENLLWWGINLYYSVPIMKDDKYCSYVPTQYLSELFKSKGYDGVLYGSSQKQGKFNLSLFDVNSADLKQRRCKTVYSVEYITNLVDLYKKEN